MYKSDYTKHLRKLAAEKRALAKVEHIKNTYAAWLKSERSAIETPEDIAPWILKNQKHIMDAVNTVPGLAIWFGDKFKPDDEITDLELSIKWANEASNSHVCPVGGVQNWCGKDQKLPKGYPGWVGSVKGSLKRNKGHMGSYPISGLLKAVGIHIGSGGGGNEHWRFEATLFDVEWPKMSESIAFDKLAGKITV